MSYTYRDSQWDRHSNSNNVDDIEFQNNQLIDQLSDSVSALRELTSKVSNSISERNIMIGETDTKFNLTSDYLQKAFSGIKSLQDSSGGCYFFILSAFICILFISMYIFIR